MNKFTALFAITLLSLGACSHGHFVTVETDYKGYQFRAYGTMISKNECLTVAHAIGPTNNNMSWNGAKYYVDGRPATYLGRFKGSTTLGYCDLGLLWIASEADEWMSVGVDGDTSFRLRGGQKVELVDGRLTGTFGPGDSGSGLVNDNGELVGVLTSISDDAEGVYSKARVIKLFLDEVRK